MHEHRHHEKKFTAARLETELVGFAALSTQVAGLIAKRDEIIDMHSRKKA